MNGHTCLIHFNWTCIYTSNFELSQNCSFMTLVTFILVSLFHRFGAFFTDLLFKGIYNQQWLWEHLIFSLAFAVISRCIGRLLLKDILANATISIRLSYDLVNKFIYCVSYKNGCFSAVFFNAFLSLNALYYRIYCPCPSPELTIFTINGPGNQIHLKGILHVLPTEMVKVLPFDEVAFVFI